MPDLISFVDFVFDIVCMMMPLNDVEAFGFGVTRDQSILISLGAVGLLVFSITISASEELFPNNAGMAVAVAVAVCVVGLGFIASDREMLTGMFVAGYPPMVITMRFAEGAMLGERTSWHIRWWHPLLMGVAIVAAFYLLRSVPKDIMDLAKAGWALIGAGLAAFAWTRIVADAPMFRSAFSVLSVFGVFAATLIYVSASSLELALFQWSLPLGLGVGIIGGRVSRRRSGSEEEHGV